MKRRELVAMLAVVGALAMVGWGAARRLGTEAVPVTRSSLVASEAISSENEAREREIVFFQKRATEDPFSAGDQAELAGRFLQRARQTGSSDDVIRAEEAARKSLALRLQRNSHTYGILALSLIEQHRFLEAREAAEELVQGDPENSSYRALLGEIQLELGDYEAARTTFGSLEPARANLDVAPRLARWEEISGRNNEARNLLYAAREQSSARIDLPREQMAWFHLREGDFELRNGRIKEAERALHAGLAISPGDYRLLAAMARLHAARHDWSRASAYGDEALARVTDPATLAMMSDIHAARGDAEKAAEYAAVVELSLSRQAQSFHRAEGLFLLNRGRRVAEIADQAAEDLLRRRDVYGYDLLAWALHKQGRNREAQAAMASALRMGTQDAVLFYHAGMIEQELGNREAAERHLQQALKLNPDFHPTEAPVARRALDALRGRASWRARLPF